METYVNLDNLKSALDVVVPVVDERSSLAAYRSLHISVSRGMITLAGHHYGTWASVSIPAETSTSFEAAVPAKMFMQYISALKGQAGKIELKITKTNLEVIIPGNTARFKLFDGLPALEPAKLRTIAQMQSGDLRRALENVLYATAASAMPTPILTTVNLSFSKRDVLESVGLDDYRLAICNTLISYADEKDNETVLHLERDFCQALSNGLDKNPDCLVSVYLDEREMVTLAIANPAEPFLSFSMGTAGLSGKFPNFRDRVPRDPILKATCDLRATQNALRAVQLMVKENSHGGIWLTWKASNDQRVEFFVESSESGRVLVTVPAIYDLPPSDEFRFSLDCNYLIAALNHFTDATSITFEFTTDREPVVLYTDDDRQAYQAVIMPIHFQS